MRISDWSSDVCSSDLTPAQQAPADAASPEPPPPADVAGKPEMPALQVTTLDGKPYDLADHRDNWVVVNFWATWGAPCRKEMPELSELDALREHDEALGRGACRERVGQYE